MTAKDKAEPRKPPSCECLGCEHWTEDIGCLKRHCDYKAKGATDEQ